MLHVEAKFGRRLYEVRRIDLGKSGARQKILKQRVVLRPQFAAVMPLADTPMMNHPITFGAENHDSHMQQSILCLRLVYQIVMHHE